jgi:hypothetical protein
LMNGTSVPTWVENPVELYTKANVSQDPSWDAEVKKIDSGALTCKNGGCPASMR